MNSTRTQHELWEKRQLFYRVYDLQGITAWKARDLLVLYDLFEEYKLSDILAIDNNSTNIATALQELIKIKEDINESIKQANKDKDFKAKAILTKKLDKVLTLIAFVEACNKEGLARITSMYRLMNRYEELRNAIKDIANADSNSTEDNEIEAITDKIREELEREIIELKKIMK